MKNVTMPLSLALVLSVSLALEAGNSTRPPQMEAENLQHQLLGAWAFAGRPGEVYEPEPGGQVKFWGERHWVVTQWDPQTGRVLFHHGGTYTLKGNNYTEIVTFASENIADQIGEVYKFKISIAGNTYTQIGDGNDYNEVWKRLVR